MSAEMIFVYFFGFSNGLSGKEMKRRVVIRKGSFM
jgi:hypothetical protein